MRFRERRIQGCERSGAAEENRLYRFELSTDIEAPKERVWRALCDPAEVLAWDPGLRAVLDAPAGYPAPGQHVCWRLRSGLWRILHDRPQEAVPQRRLRSLLAAGPFHYDETYTLTATARGCRLTANLAVWTAIPLAGGLIDRLYLGPATRKAFQASLAAIKRLAEGSS